MDLFNPINKDLTSKQIDASIHKKEPSDILKDLVYFKYLNKTPNGTFNLLECKNVNQSRQNGCSFDIEAYKNKILELKEAYKYVSMITDHTN